MRFSQQNRNRGKRRTGALGRRALVRQRIVRPLVQPFAVISHLLVLCLIFSGFHLDYGCQCPDCDRCQSDALSLNQFEADDSSCSCCHAESGCCSDTSDTSDTPVQVAQKGCACCDQANLNYQIGELDPAITFSPLVLVQLTPDLSGQVLECPLDIPSDRAEFLTGRVPVHLLNCVWQI